MQYIKPYPTFKSFFIYKILNEFFLHKLNKLYMNLIIFVNFFSNVKYAPRSINYEKKNL